MNLKSLNLHWTAAKAVVRNLRDLALVLARTDSADLLESALNDRREFKQVVSDVEENDQ